MKTLLGMKFIPLAILWTIVLVSFVVTLSTEYILGISVLHGSLLLIICTFGFIYNKKFYRYVMFGNLILGSIGLVKFSFYEITFALGYEGAGSIGIQVLPTIVLFMFIFLHQDQIRNTISSDSNSKDDIDSRTLRIKAFKSRFINLSNVEIARRLNDKMVPEAIEALRQLKEEREEEE